MNERIVPKRAETLSGERTGLRSATRESDTLKITGCVWVEPA